MSVIADMDGDGLAVIAVGRAIFDYTGAVIDIGAFGKGAAPALGNPNNGYYGAVSAIVELDADGVQEVVTGNAAYDLDGNTIWQNGELDGIVAVADFDLDGLLVDHVLPAVPAGSPCSPPPRWSHRVQRPRRVTFARISLRGSAVQWCLL